MKKRFFKKEFIEHSEISEEETKGISHYRDTYEREKIIKHEKIDKSGNAIKITDFEYLNDFIYSRHKDIKKGDLNIAYTIKKDKTKFYKNRRVIFNKNGEVFYPISSKKEKDKKIKILDSINIYPDMDLEILKKYKDKKVQLSLPKKRDIYRLNNKKIRNKLNDNNIDVKLAHGPEIDIFEKDFIANLAWIRGNFSIDTITIHPKKGSYGSAIDLLKEKEDKLKEISTDIAYENIDSDKSWFKYIECLPFDDLSNIKATLDISHLDPNSDIEKIIGELGKNLKVIHLSNIQKNKKHLPIDLGEYNLYPILNLLKDKKFDGYLVLEYLPEYKEKEIKDTQKLREFFEV